MKDQNKKWVTHICCINFSSTLNESINGKSVICNLQYIWFERNLTITRVIVISVYLTLLRIKYRWKRNRPLCTMIYDAIRPLLHSKNFFLILNLHMMCIRSLKKIPVFHQTAKNNSCQLQGIQISCQAQNPRFIKGHKRNSIWVWKGNRTQALYQASQKSYIDALNTYTSLKAVFLLNGNVFPPILLSYATIQKKHKYVRILIAEYYVRYQWEVCGDFKIIAISNRTLTRLHQVLLFPAWVGIFVPREPVMLQRDDAYDDH